MAYHRASGYPCDKCRTPITGGHCACCGVLGWNGLRTTVCDCGGAWSEYTRNLVRELRAAIHGLDLFVGVYEGVALDKARPMELIRLHGRPKP